MDDGDEPLAIYTDVDRGCTSAYHLPGSGELAWEACDEDSRAVMIIGPRYGAVGVTAYDLEASGARTRTFELPGAEHFDIAPIGWETPTGLVLRVVSYEAYGDSGRGQETSMPPRYVAVRCAVDTGTCERLPHPVEVMATSTAARFRRTDAHISRTWSHTSARMSLMRVGVPRTAHRALLLEALVKRRWRTWCGRGAAAVSLVLVACAGGDVGPGAPSGETLSYFTTEPVSLFPGMTEFREGMGVLNALFSPLVGHDETGALYPIVASELPISADSVHWTIKIVDGWTFHNGEPVTAQSFVDAWNWTAYGPNAMSVGYFFGPGMADIVGYDDVQGGVDPDEDGPQVAPRPGTDTMSGLRVLDALTFTVTLAHPRSQFPLMLGHPAFYPLPATCIEDWEACNETPIGNGPFRMNGTWEHDRRISVVAYERFAGRRPSIGGVEFRISASPQASARDLQEGQLDFMIGIPAEMTGSVRAALGDRLINKPSNALTYLAFPMWDDRFGFGGAETEYGGEAGQNLRHALSMAIERDRGTNVALDDRAPADSLIPPGVPGYRAGACGEWCRYDVAAAKELYEASPGIEGTIDIWCPGFPGQEAHLTDIAESWHAAFGVEVEVHALGWADFLQRKNDHTLNGPFTNGWSMDYPSPDGFLLPLYAEGPGEENFGYVDDGANRLMADAATATTVEGGLELYALAEDEILEDMPVIPGSFWRTIGGYSDRVRNVSLDPYDRLDFTTVTVTS